MSAHTHYASLFSPVAREFGPEHTKTLTAIIGFTAGGPVSVSRFGQAPVYVTCELSLNPDQKVSAQGLKFELMSRLPLTDSDSQDFLTSLGALSLEATLGDRHTIDVSAVSPSPDIVKVQLKLFSSCEVGGEKFGIYEVCNAV